MYRILKKARDQNSRSKIIFISALLLSFHYYLITYINSTFLGGLVKENMIGVLYALGSLLNIVLFLKTPSWIKKIGNYNFIWLISLLELFSIAGLAFAKSPILGIIAFIIHHSINPVILSCLDMYLEDNANTEHMGKLRGTFLTIISIAAIISPLAIGSLVSNGYFDKIYSYSLFFMFIFLFWIILNFKKMPSAEFKAINIKEELKEFARDPKIKNVTFCNIFLQFFYSWMIIYVPLYLVQWAGFAWSESAVIISISLLPFLLFEIPIGEIVDKKLDEREMMMSGFLISALVLFFFPIIPKGAFIFWTIALFIARMGASIIETSSESYFFRNTKGKDELIEVFRITGPFAFIVGPLAGSALLFFLPFNFIFPFLGGVMLLGVLFAARIHPPKIFDFQKETNIS